MPLPAFPLLLMLVCFSTFPIKFSWFLALFLLLLFTFGRAEVNSKQNATAQIYGPATILVYKSVFRQKTQHGRKVNSLSTQYPTSLEYEVKPALDFE